MNSFEKIIEKIKENSLYKLSFFEDGFIGFLNDNDISLCGKYDYSFEMYLKQLIFKIRICMIF